MIRLFAIELQLQQRKAKQRTKGVNSSESIFIVIFESFDIMVMHFQSKNFQYHRVYRF